jgi:hypothetical protein
MSQFDSQASSAPSAGPISPLQTRPEGVELSGMPSQNSPQSDHTDNILQPPIACAPGVPRSSPVTRWGVTEVSMLIGFKRGEKERQLLGGQREKMKTASQRWAQIREDFAKNGVERTSQQVKSKWEKLTTDWKKVYDYQRNKPSGQPGYFEMESDQKKDFNLPAQFDQEIFNLLECWYPEQRAVNPDRANLMDSCTIHQEGIPDVVNIQHSQSDDVSESGNEENIPPTENNANVPPPPDAQGRRKKTRRDRLDEHFSKANNALLSAMSAENEKRALHDQAVLEWEKERVQTQIATELQMHQQELAVRAQIGNQVALALGDLAKSFADFTSKMAEKK